MNTALYRLFDVDGELVYVGITNNPAMRWSQHSAYSEWWSRVSSKSVEWHDTRAAAEKAERVAIRCEGPLFNRAHIPCAGMLRDGEVARDRSALGELDRQKRSSWVNLRHRQTHRPLFGLIAEELREDIKAGRLRSGSRLPTYHAMQKRFGTSTGPIAMALEMLEEEGTIERQPGKRGARVAAA